MIASILNFKKRSFFAVSAAALLGLASCSTTQWNVTQKNGQILPVTSAAGSVSQMDELIAPYKASLDREMAQPLSFAPITYDKVGQWNCSVGDLFALATHVAANKAFELRYHKKIDGVFMNIGGVRSILPEGQVSLRNAFELMPFENQVCVVAMQKKDIEKLIQFFIDGKKAHPMSGIAFQLDAEHKKATKIWINGQELQEQQLYYIATNDYLYNGGDNMSFFKEAGEKMVLDYKLRNVLIDYFKVTPTLPTTFNPIIIP